MKPYSLKYTHYRQIATNFGCPPELDSKTQLLKTRHALTVGPGTFTVPEVATQASGG